MHVLHPFPVQTLATTFQEPRRTYTHTSIYMRPFHAHTYLKRAEVPLLLAIGLCGGLETPPHLREAPPVSSTCQ